MLWPDKSLADTPFFNSFDRDEPSCFAFFAAVGALSSRRRFGAALEVVETDGAEETDAVAADAPRLAASRAFYS